MKKIKVEIWSDILCPFCYISKRRLEKALTTFEYAGQVEVHWRSFELYPDANPAPGVSYYSQLAAKYGQTEDWARQMGASTTQLAAEDGLAFNFNQAVHANSLRAHCLVHLAARHGQQDAAKERLFKGHFEEGLDVNDVPTLTRMGVELGLPAAEVAQLLASRELEQQVRYDEYQARQIGVRGVPYFVFNDKYTVSGAQSAELFREVLEQVWKASQPVELAGTAETVCDLDGNC